MSDPSLFPPRSACRHGCGEKRGDREENQGPGRAVPETREPGRRPRLSKRRRRRDTPFYCQGSTKSPPLLELCLAFPVRIPCGAALVPIPGLVAGTPANPRLAGRGLGVGSSDRRRAERERAGTKKGAQARAEKAQSLLAMISPLTTRAHLSYSGRISDPQKSHSTVFGSIQLASLPWMGPPHLGQLVGRRARCPAPGTAEVGTGPTLFPNSAFRASAARLMPLAASLRVMLA